MDILFRFYADISEPGGLETVPVIAHSRKEAEWEAAALANTGYRPEDRKVSRLHDWDRAILPGGIWLTRQEALSSSAPQLEKLMKSRRNEAMKIIARLRSAGTGWDRINLRQCRGAHSFMARRRGDILRNKEAEHADLNAE